MIFTAKSKEIGKKSSREDILETFLMIFHEIFAHLKYSLYICQRIAAMLLSYFVGQKKYPINYPVKEIMIYVVLALILFVGMTEANKYFSTAIACLINTVLILLFAAYLVKKDFPLKSLPVVGKYFRK